MKRKIRVFYFLGFSVLALGSIACSNVVQNTASQATSSTMTSSTKKSIPVTVTWKRAATAIVKSASARSLDPSVCSVTINVFDATSGTAEGTGSLSSLGAGNGFAGTITVNETGPVVFEATACCAGGSVLDVARTNYTVTGIDDSVILAAVAATLMGGTSQGQPLSLSTVVTLLAGSPTGGSGLTNASAGTSAMFASPIGITTDGTNLYVVDWGKNEIRQIVIATGEVTLLAGSPTGASGATNSTTGTSATFNHPQGITTDGTNLYVADMTNNEIRKIVIATGAVSLFAGSPTGQFGVEDGTTYALFSGPMGITTDGTNLYVADANNNEIRKIVLSTGVVSTLAGSNTSGRVNSTGTYAEFNHPCGITTDGTNLYVTDMENNEIRKIVIATEAVTLFAGNSMGGSGWANGMGPSACFYYPRSITTDGTNLYVADEYNNEIRQIVISTGGVTSLAGSSTGSSGSHGYTNGIGTSATFYYPSGITTDGINLYVVDTDNNEIRMIQ